MAEAIGALWEEGEDSISKKNFHEALLSFQRAKTLLNGSSSNQQQNSGKVSQLTGEILSKLTISIDKCLAELNANPIIALQLQRGFKHAELKRSYRGLALRYHPDKNQDCDTSCIFAVIQSAYEKLRSSMPNSQPVDQEVESKAAAKQNMYDTFGNRAKSDSTGQECRFEASHISSFSTAELRERLKRFLGADSTIDSMNRAMLLKRCLGLSNHVQNQLQRQKAGMPYDKEFCKAFEKAFGQFSSNESKSNPSAATSSSKKQSYEDPAAKWTDDMRREMDKEKEKEKMKQQRTRHNQPKPERSNSARANFEESWDTYMNSRSREGQVPPSSTSSSAPKVSDPIREPATAEEWAKVLPTMKVSQLKNLMIARGIETADCIEKTDMLHRLYKHFGITTFPDINSSHPSSFGQQSDSNRQQQYFPDLNNKPPSHRPNSANPKKYNSVEAAMKANMFKFMDGQSGGSHSNGIGGNNAVPSPNPKGKLHSAMYSKSSAGADSEAEFGMSAAGSASAGFGGSTETTGPNAAVSSKPYSTKDNVDRSSVAKDEDINLGGFKVNNSMDIDSLRHILKMSSSATRSSCKSADTAAAPKPKSQQDKDATDAADGQEKHYTNIKSPLASTDRDAKARTATSGGVEKHVSSNVLPPVKPVTSPSKASDDQEVPSQFDMLFEQFAKVNFKAAHYKAMKFEDIEKLDHDLEDLLRTESLKFNTARSSNSKLPAIHAKSPPKSSNEHSPVENIRIPQSGLMGALGTDDPDDNENDSIEHDQRSSSAASAADRGSGSGGFDHVRDADTVHIPHTGFGLGEEDDEDYDEENIINDSGTWGSQQQRLHMASTYGHHFPDDDLYEANDNDDEDDGIDWMSTAAVRLSKR